MADLPDTRQQILAMLLKYGPITASDLGERLGISAAGVRRHLDILVEEEVAETVDRKTTGRGRPAKHFRLTDHGRGQFGHEYDTLASAAINALRDVAGEDAVRSFARSRIEAVIGDITPADDTQESVEQTTRELAEAFNESGYAVTVTRAGAGIQICQHHCPVAEVAKDHPEICEAEHEVIASKVGLHIQPLANMTDGHGICTTHIPLTPIFNERSRL